MGTPMGVLVTFFFLALVDGRLGYRHMASHLALRSDSHVQRNPPQLALRGGGNPTMTGWNEDGQADPDILAAMLSLRNYGDENRTLTPLAIDPSSTQGTGFKEIARYAVGAEGGSASCGLAALKEGEIRTPNTDTRAYKHITLSNGLQAMLVSDPEAFSAAAALCVSVGQMDDPECVQGLAHFLEHMLFLGTEKFPEESNFDQFCASAAGYSNAWTSLDHTMYHFIVSKSKLQEALDRFAAFFSCPLFSPDGTEREMKAVDSEHNKNLQDDDRREYQLMRATSAASHPMSRFGAGNMRSLFDLPKQVLRCIPTTQKGNPSVSLDDAHLSH